MNENAIMPEQEIEELKRRNAILLEALKEAVKRRSYNTVWSIQALARATLVRLGEQA